MKRNVFGVFQRSKLRCFTGRWEQFCAWPHAKPRSVICCVGRRGDRMLRHEFRRGSAFIGQTLKSGATAYLIANLFWDEDLQHVHRVNAETRRSSDKHEQPQQVSFWSSFLHFDGLKDEKTHNHLRRILLKWICFTLQSSWWRRQMWLLRHYLTEYKFKAEIGAMNRNFTAVKRRKYIDWKRDCSLMSAISRRNHSHENKYHCCHRRKKPWPEISVLMRTRGHKHSRRWKMEEVEATCCSHKTAGNTVAVESRSQRCQTSSQHWQKEILKSRLIFHADPFWDWSVISAVKRRDWQLEQQCLINCSQQIQSQAAASHPGGTVCDRSDHSVVTDRRPTEGDSWKCQQYSSEDSGNISGVCPMLRRQIEELTDQTRKEVWTFTQHLAHLSVKAEGVTFLGLLHLPL